MLALLSDPVILFAIAIFFFIMAYFIWQDRKAKEKQLEERIRRLEEQQQKAKQNSDSESK